MNILYPFSDELVSSAINYVNGSIGEIIFSHSNYQIKVWEKTTEQWLWIFIHLNHTYQLEESLCPCEQFMHHRICVHIVASYIVIFHSHPEPLHIRFERSIWHAIFSHMFRVSEEENLALSQDPEGYLLRSMGDIICRISTHGNKVAKEIEELFFHRVIETEETSMKFSHLPQEELELWRKKFQVKNYDMNYPYGRI